MTTKETIFRLTGSVLSPSQSNYEERDRIMSDCIVMLGVADTHRGLAGTIQIMVLILLLDTYNTIEPQSSDTMQS